MKKTFFIILISVSCNNLHAQLDTGFATKRIVDCADSLSIGFLSKNWDMFMRYSYPAVIGAMGGKEEFIKQVKERLGMIPDSSWKRYEPGKVLQIVKTGKDLQAIVELFSILEWQGVRISTTHHLVAESWDGGYHWTFFDSQNDRDMASVIKPDLSPELIIPPKMEKMEQLNQ